MSFITTVRVDQSVLKCLRDFITNVYYYRKFKLYYKIFVAQIKQAVFSRAFTVFLITELCNKLDACKIYYLSVPQTLIVIGFKGFAV